MRQRKSLFIFIYFILVFGQNSKLFEINKHTCFKYVQKISLKNTYPGRVMFFYDFALLQ